MKGGDGPPGSGIFSLFAAAGGDTDALSRASFGQGSGLGTTASGTGVTDGIEMVALNHENVSSGMFGSKDLDTTLALGIILDETIKFGQTGQFKGMVTGATGEGDSAELILGSKDGSTATVDVIQWNDDVLHLSLKGEYCLRSNYDFIQGKCRKVENFSGEIVNPFGWAYDPARTFMSKDTPGMAEYRKLMGGNVEENSASAGPGSSSSSPGSPSDPPSTDGIIAGHGLHGYMHEPVVELPRDGLN